MMEPLRPDRGSKFTDCPELDSGSCFSEVAITTTYGVAE